MIFDRLYNFNKKKNDVSSSLSLKAAYPRSFPRLSRFHPSSPSQIKAAPVISTRDVVELEGGAGRMGWLLARKSLAEWSYVLDWRQSSRIEECDALLSGVRLGRGAGERGVGGTGCIIAHILIRLLMDSIRPF